MRWNYDQRIRRHCPLFLHPRLAESVLLCAPVVQGFGVDWPWRHGGEGGPGSQGTGLFFWRENSATSPLAPPHHPACGSTGRAQHTDLWETVVALQCTAAGPAQRLLRTALSETSAERQRRLQWCVGGGPGSIGSMNRDPSSDLEHRRRRGDSAPPLPRRNCEGGVSNKEASK